MSEPLAMTAIIVMLAGWYVAFLWAMGIWPFHHRRPEWHNDVRQLCDLLGLTPYLLRFAYWLARRPKHTCRTTGVLTLGDPHRDFYCDVCGKTFVHKAHIYETDTP